LSCAKGLQVGQIEALLGDYFNEGLPPYFDQFAVEESHKALEHFDDILRDPPDWLLEELVLNLIFVLLEECLKVFEILHFQFLWLHFLYKLV
jgi:hypothetical protein